LEGIKIPKILNWFRGTVYFDDSLLELYRKELISLESALEFAENPTDLSLKIKGVL